LTKYDEMIKQRRDLLKAHDYNAFPPEDWWEPDQRKGVAPPPLEKPYDENTQLIDLVESNEFNVGRISLIDAIANRESRRVFTDEPLTLKELSFLLWATQGVRVVDENKVWTKRVVPSGGGRQPFETYLLVDRVNGIKRGIYRYLPIEHKLILVSENLPNAEELMESSGNICLGRCSIQDRVEIQSCEL